MGTTQDHASHPPVAVLVVEDEPLVRTVAAEILIEAGYLAFEARDDIGVVFTDIEMPGMTGLVLAATVRERWPAIGVLVTSGRIRPLPGGLPQGADFIAKPYKSAELLDQLARLVAR